MVENNNVLKEKDELLLMKFADGECSFLERLRVKKLLNSSILADRYFDETANCGKSVRDWSDSFSDSIKVDLWKKIEANITKEERKLYSKNTKGNSIRLNIFDRILNQEVISRLGWSLGGAFVTASIGFLVMRPNALSNLGNNLTNSSVETSAKSGNYVTNENISNISLGNVNDPPSSEIPIVVSESELEPTRSFHSSVELDWLKSQGQLRLIQDPRQRSTILWIKRSPKRYSEYNTKTPVPLEEGETPSGNFGSGIDE